MTGRTGTSETLRGAHRQPMPCTCLELAIREAHLGQRSQTGAQKAGHMSASDPIKLSQPILASRGPMVWIPPLQAR